MQPIPAIDPRHDVLIVTDVQNDFCPGGALAVPNGDQVVPVINAVSGAYPVVVTTQDWHPADHISFVSRGGPWPPHCVAGTRGAELHPALDVSRVDITIRKAETRDTEAYSGFDGTNLADLLRERGVTDVTVAGLATDYCVKATALDALREGFRVTVFEDASRPVEVNPGDGTRALDNLREAGVTVARAVA